MGNMVSVAPEFLYSVVDVTDNSTTVLNAKGILSGIYINTVLSAHALPIKDGSTTVFTIPASTAAGNWFPFGDTVFATSIVVDPNDSATGNITVVYKPAD